MDVSNDEANNKKMARSRSPSKRSKQDEKLVSKEFQQNHKLNNARCFDAALPLDVKWRLYVFDQGRLIDGPFDVDKKSRYTFGRDEHSVDIPTLHDSCDMQHAVLQYLQIENKKIDGTILWDICPCLMDTSVNGTYINDRRLPHGIFCKTSEIAGTLLNIFR